MAFEDELIAIKLELKGQRETIAGLKSVDRSTEALGGTTKRTGTEAERADRKTRGLSRAYNALGTATKYALGFLGVGGIFALKSAITNTEDLAKTTAGLVRNFGLEEEAASRWAAVAYGRGVDSKAMSMAFATLSSRMTEAARKGGTLLTPFHQLGLTQDEVAEGADDFESGILRVADALGAMEGGAKRTTAAKALLGKGYATLLPLFSEGTKGLKEQLEWADKYGVTLDGKTTDAVMGLVSAQRESKVAMLGLQVALSTALMPAIEAGQDELQEFIATLNDPKLTDEQKFRRISRQFNRITDAIIDIVTDAAPEISERAGQLGIRMAIGLWHGFREADVLGKVVIGAFIFKILGGRALVDAAAKRVGMRIGGRIAIGVALGVIGYELWEKISDQTKDDIRQWAINAGENFVNALIEVLNWGIRKINDSFNATNPLGDLPFGLSVDAPQIGEVGNVDFDDGSAADSAAARAMREGKINGPGGKLIPGQTFPPIGKNRGKSSTASDPRGRLPLGRLSAPAPELPRDLAARAGMGGVSRARPIQVNLQNVIKLDGEVIARQVAKHVADDESLS